jgi:hypothetical protein
LFFPVTQGLMQPRAIDLSDARLVTTEEVLGGLPGRPFLAGLAFYERHPDKPYSLVDCISTNAMCQKHDPEILTHYRHLSQEGFLGLLDDQH